MGLAEDECLLSHSVALWERLIVADWQLWHPISETLYGHELFERSRPLKTVLQQRCLERSQAFSVKEPLSLLAQTAAHNAAPCMDQHQVCFRSREDLEIGGVATPIAFCFAALLRSWLQGRAVEAALALPGRWSVPSCAQRSWFLGMHASWWSSGLHAQHPPGYGKEQC